MDKAKVIVAAELLGIVEKQSFFSALMFSMAGSKVAGFPGAIAGANLAPSSVIYRWRVMYEDFTTKKVNLRADDPRNTFWMELPYLPAYKEEMGLVGPLKIQTKVPKKRKHKVIRQGNDNRMKFGEVYGNSNSARSKSMNENVQYSRNTCNKAQSNSVQGSQMQTPVTRNIKSNSEGATGALVIGAGDYVFGENIPEGCFDLQVISGEGSLWLYEIDGSYSLIWIGGQEDGTGAYCWNGLSSSKYKSFTIKDSARVQIKRAAKFNI